MNQRNLTRILPLLLFFAVGCNSLKRKADRQFEAGQFGAAAELYERVLARDAGDAKAQERLKISRQHVIEDRLIEIRQLRMSENFLEALDKMSQTVIQESKWQIAPSGAAYSTQTEEVEQLYRWFSEQVANDLNDGKFLKAKIFNDEYRDIFLAGDWRRKELGLSNQIINRGSQHCQEMKNLAQGPYAREFVNRYCIYWGQSESTMQRADHGPLASHEIGFAQVRLSGTIKGIPEDLLSALSDDLLEALRKTPFFDPSGGELKVALQGDFVSSYEEHPTIALHSYYVQIPYQVTVSVPYTESEPYTNYRTNYNSQTGQTTQEPYTDYRNVTRYREEMETHYRSEERSLNYPATEYNLHYVLTGKAIYTIDRVPHEIPLSNQIDQKGSYHEFQDLQIGLGAKEKDAPTTMAWLKEKFAASSPSLTAQVITAWDAKYCQIPQSLQDRIQIESVMKCLKGANQNHDFVENWFKSKFGLPYKTVGQTIGFGV